MTDIPCKKCDGGQLREEKLVWRFGETTAFCGYLTMVMGWSVLAYGLLCLSYPWWPDFVDNVAFGMVIVGWIFGPYLPVLSLTQLSLIFTAMGLIIVVIGRVLSRSQKALRCNKCGSVVPRE